MALLICANEFEIAVQVTEWRERRVRLAFEVVREDNRLASGFEVCVLGRARRRALRGREIPAEFRALIEQAVG